MPIALGLDIGSNSVGSAWVDTDKKDIQVGVSIFPAGVDETDTKRGAPVGQKRRTKRSQRKSLARRAARKLALRNFLTNAALLPSGKSELQQLFQLNPWLLRREGLRRELTPHEFGRILVHLNQRRGALGVEPSRNEEAAEESEKAKEDQVVKAGISRLHRLMKERHAKTFGQLMADLMEERKTASAPIRNRQYRLDENLHLYADRATVQAEFNLLWTTQKSFGGKLAETLNAQLLRDLDEAGQTKTWRHKGLLFGQRRTYWDTGTLGRCDLEPTDRCCSIGDMFAQEFRVLETVNNLRIQKRGEEWRYLTNDERTAVLHVLQGGSLSKPTRRKKPETQDRKKKTQKTASPATIRAALGIDTKEGKTFYSLNVELDEDREINTDWFYREIVHGAFTEEAWLKLNEKDRNAINRALLTLDPEKKDDEKKLLDGSQAWWNLSLEAANVLVKAWKDRPNPDKRVKLSRRAILHLLPYLRSGLSVTEARDSFRLIPVAVLIHLKGQDMP